MPLHRLVHLIESHSQELASELLNRVHQSPHLTSFSKVPDHELRQRVHEIYSHLGQWLMSRTEGEIARQYAEIGARLRASRARRGGFRFHRELAPSSVSKARMLRSSDDLPSAGPSFLGNSGFIVGEKARNGVPFLPVLILSERSSPSRVRFPAPKKRRALDCCGPL